MWWFTTLLGIIVSVAQLASSDVVLVQWGRRDCEGRGAELVYSGLMAGPSKTGWKLDGRRYRNSTRKVTGVINDCAV